MHSFENNLNSIQDQGEPDWIKKWNGIEYKEYKLLSTVALISQNIF
jgi:hypothetical protein